MLRENGTRNMSVKFDRGSSRRSDDRKMIGIEMRGEIADTS